MRSILIIVVTIVFTVSSCKSEDIQISEMEEATIINGGEPALDGCGWLLKIKEVNYSPVGGLEEAFREDELKVNIAYKLLKTYSNCGFNINAHQNIEIVSIKKK